MAGELIPIVSVGLIIVKEDKMIEIYINRVHGEKGNYFMSLQNPDTMNEKLILHFDCVHCISAMIDTLTWATTNEIDITNYVWEDWEDGAACSKGIQR